MPAASPRLMSATTSGGRKLATLPTPAGASYHPPMPFTDESLIDKALHALIEFTRLHKDGSMTRREKAMLRFTLAFLYRGGDRAPYDDFWTAASAPKGEIEAREFGRFQTMRGALAAICRQHGRDYW